MVQADREFMLSAAAVEELLKSQKLLNEQLKSLSLLAVQQLLHAEARGKRRYFFISRLHGRYNKLRVRRERIALLKGEPWPL